MKYKFFSEILFVLLALLFSIPFISTAITASNGTITKFILRLAPDPQAASREIQWLQKADDLEELSSEEAEPFEGDLLELEAPLAPFFRVRAKNGLGQAGPWSEVYPADSFVVTTQEEEVIEIEEEPTLPEMQVVFTTTGEAYLKRGLISFPPDTRGEIWLSLNKGLPFPYTQEIQLEHNKRYDLEISFRNKKGRELSRQQYQFKVDLIPPRTRRLVYAPAFIGKQICFTPKSQIVFFANDRHSGVVQTMCRFSPEEEFKPCPSPLTLPESFKQNCRHCITLEYYSIDRAENQEKIRREQFGFFR